jgi:hypothetical protein
VLSTAIQDVHKAKYGKCLCRSCIQRLHYKNGIRKSCFSEYNKSNKGKSLEERLGIEGATACRLKLSIKTSGKNNPNYGGKYSKFEKSHDARRGKTYEESLGKEKAARLRKKLSIATSGKNNPMYGKPSPKNSGKGLHGMYKGMYFRSLLELSYMKYLHDNSIRFISAESKRFRVEYTLDNVSRTYHPDYYLVDSDTVVEIKPVALINTYANKAKFEAATVAFKGNFKVLTERDFNKLTVDEVLSLCLAKEITVDKDSQRQCFINYFNKQLSNKEVMQDEIFN